MPSLNITLPPYTVVKTRRDGALAFYFQVPKRLRPAGWAGGYRLPLDALARTGKGDPEELALVIRDANAMLARLRGEKAKLPEAARHGTLPWLIQDFEQSDRYRQLKPRSQQVYQYCARQVMAWSQAAGHPPIAKINQPAILVYLSTMDSTPRKRNLVASYLRALMAHAMRKGLRETNPARALGLTRAKRIKQIHIWTDGELTAKMAAADAMGRSSIATALLIAHDQGFRPGDTLRLQRGRDYDARTGRFKFRCEKTGEWVECDASSRVQARLAAQPREQLLLIVNEATGKVYNERVFHRHFDAIRGRDKHLWFRELRHTHIVKARRAGLTPKEIAGRSGHATGSVDKILEEYYSPHDTEVIQLGAAKWEAYLQRQPDETEQKSDTRVGRQLDTKA